MKTKQIYHLAFQLHRYIGLAIGLILLIVGLTGSILVFQKEIDHFLITQKFGKIEVQAKPVEISSIINNFQEFYREQPERKLDSLRIPLELDAPYKVWLQTKDEKWKEVFINPYTGKILGERQWENSLIGFIFDLHYALTMGRIGQIIMGIVAFLLLILSLSGILLWPGWRKLIAGLKIRFQAHPKRVNYDIHKVAGIITAFFLAMIALSGFCWNFSEISEPLIYSLTFSPKPSEVIVTPPANQSVLNIQQLLQKADEALPGAVTVGFDFLEKESPEQPFRVRKRFPQEPSEYGRSFVYLNPYTGEVLQIQNALKPSRAEAVWNSFMPMHFGTFGGLPTRILYVFVGLAPTILLITGLVMWSYRRKKPSLIFNRVNKKQTTDNNKGF